MSRRHALIGASKPYLYKEEDAEFYYRQTSGGVIMNNSPLVGSIDRIKGQTIAWNQLFYPDTSSVSNNGVTVDFDGYKIHVHGTKESSNSIYIRITPNLVIRFISGHKYFFDIPNRIKSVFQTQVSGLNDNTYINYEQRIVTASKDGNGHVIIRGGGNQGAVIDWTGYINIFDLTLIYGEGNEPSTPEEFEADYQRWFGKPLTYEPYDEGSLRNVQMEGIKTTFTNANPQTKYFDVTTLTGKLNGQGESVIIFPDGMKGVGDVKDEIYIEDGVTKAVKRIGRVDLGSFTYSDYRYSEEMASTYPYGYTPSINIPNKAGRANTYCSFYLPTLGFQHNKAVVSHSTNSTLYIIDSSFIWYSGNQIKTAMQGVYLDYELAEPQVYVLDTPLPIAYNCEASGTEQILPENSGTPTSIAPIMDITYNIGQINN